MLKGGRAPFGADAGGMIIGKLGCDRWPVIPVVTVSQFQSCLYSNLVKNGLNLPFLCADDSRKDSGEFVDQKLIFLIWSDIR